MLVGVRIRVEELELYVRENGWEWMWVSVGVE
jgi:hypothetical protein